jgi:uncharacterized protein YbjT (DUF2867 family)
MHSIKELGASALVGNIEDVVFLQHAFDSADAVYTMIPPKWDAADWKEHIGQVGEKYAEALRNSNVKYVVNLSSLGAHLADGAGPISGLHRAEEALNQLKDVNIRHLRPAYFYHNLLSNIPLIRQAGIIGGNFEIEGNDFAIVDPQDIATAAAEELLKLDFKGHSVRYVASDEVSTGRIASVLGNAIGKPELPWVRFSDEQAFEGMVQAGLSEEVARNYVEMGQALQSGKLSEDYRKHRPELGAVKLEDFAQLFAGAYQAAH